MKRIWSRVRVERTVWQIVRSIGDALRLSTKQEQVPGAWEAQGALDLPGGLDAIRNANSYNALLIIADLIRSKPVRRRYAHDTGLLLKVARFGIAKYKLELPNPKLSGCVSVDRRTLFDTITFFIRAIVYENSAPWQKIGETEVKDAIWEMSAFACVAQENEVDFEIMREINYGLDPSSEAVGYTNWKSHEKAAHERMAADARAYFRSLGPFSDSCDFCGAEEQMGSKLQRCEACKASRYCSKECQRGAWKDGHRETCGKAWGQLMRLGKRTLKSEDRENFRSNLDLNLPTS